MSKLVKGLNDSVESFGNLVSQFSQSKREEILFEDWNLKDILVHLTGWADYQVRTLRNFKKNKKIKSENDLKGLINGRLVLKNKKSGWDKVLKAFKKSTQKLISEYESLPANYWSKKIFEDKDTSLESFIKIEIKHYKETHGPQVKHALEID